MHVWLVSGQSMCEGEQIADFPLNDLSEIETSAMSRRYTCNTEDYPEHLNPFREDNEADHVIKNKFDTIGRRKLKTVLSLTSWTPFPTKKTKPAEQDNTVFQKLNRSKFLTMTPKISRGLMERLSQRTNRNRNSAPASNPVPSSDQLASYSDFKIMPRSSREKFAIKSEREERERYDAETASYLWGVESISPTSPGADVASPTTPIREVNEDYDLSDETKHAKQGARPRKKRQAPLPPPPTPADNKQDFTPTAAAGMEEPLVSSVPSSPEPPLACVPESPLSSVPESTLSSVPEQPMSSVPESTLPSVPESPLSSVPESTLPSVPEQPMSSVPESTLPSMPESPLSSVPEQPISSVPESTLPSVPESPLSSAPEPLPESKGNINLATQQVPEAVIDIREETLTK